MIPVIYASLPLYLLHCCTVRRQCGSALLFLDLGLQWAIFPRRRLLVDAKQFRHQCVNVSQGVHCIPFYLRHVFTAKCSNHQLFIVQITQTKSVE
jgi:hypothetical protein